MDCEICHGTRWKSVTVDGVERLTRCDCWRGGRGPRRYLAEARIPPKFARAELTTYKPDTDSQRDALRLRQEVRRVVPGRAEGPRVPRPAPASARRTWRSASQGRDPRQGRARLLLPDHRAAAPGARNLQPLRRRNRDGGARARCSRPTCSCSTTSASRRPRSGCRKRSAWSINTRYNARRATIITSNLRDPIDNTDMNSFMLQLGGALALAPARDVRVGRNAGRRHPRRRSHHQRRQDRPDAGDRPSASRRRTCPARPAAWPAPDLKDSGVQYELNWSGWQSR